MLIPSIALNIHSKPLITDIFDTPAGHLCDFCVGVAPQERQFFFLSSS
ncbi:hypothetical protein [Citrobacter freundii]|nr:hypothetical protein [Citrobacter freundii]MCO4151547.1 hypothetical protein [Citrobacter freundii]MCO4178267.1 hypothetical protein [Citrobacter freundii]